MSVNFIFRTDVHAADQSPSSWKGDYPAEIWESLRQIGVLAQKHKCSAVLDGGDFFHVKSPTRNSHALVAKAVVTQQAYPCPTYCVIGNHDIKHNNLDTVSEQPLGVLLESGVFKLLTDQTFESDGVKVRVVGVHYSMLRPLEDLLAIQKKSDEYLVCVVHALASEKPPAKAEGFFGESVFKYSDLVTKRGPDVWCFGHWHQDQGIVEVDGKIFVNLGAVSRGSLNRENIGRTPKVALLSFTNDIVDVKPLPLKVAPSSEVFDLERKQRQDQETNTIDTFVQVMQDGLKTSGATDMDTAIKSIGFSDDVANRALQYLRQARGEG